MTLINESVIKVSILTWLKGFTVVGLPRPGQSFLIHQDQD